MLAKNVTTLDSSKTSNFLECPQAYAFSHIEHLGLDVVQSSEAMNAGTYGHKLLEEYYKLRHGGMSLNDAMEGAFKFPIDEYFCECSHVLECHGPGCTKCSCTNFTPKPYSLSQDLRMSVRQRLREYFFTYSPNDFSIESPEHLEVGFSEILYEDNYDLFIIEGRIDMLASLQGLPCIVDHKFQMRTHNLYKKSVQFKTYALVSKIPMLVVNYVRLTKGITKDTLVRDIVCFNSLEMKAWKDQLIDIFYKVRDSERTSFDKNWSACGGRYGYNCIYAPLCEEPNSELVQIKKGNYVKKEIWRPW